MYIYDIFRDNSPQHHHFACHTVFYMTSLPCLKPSIDFSIPSGLGVNSLVQTGKISVACWGAMC